MDEKVVVRKIRITTPHGAMTDKTQSDELIGDQTREELYGKSLVQNLAKELTATYGSGFDFSSLYKYIRFYQCFPNILDTATPKSFLLDRSHYRTLLQVEDEKSATASQKSEKVYHRYLKNVRRWRTK